MAKLILRGEEGSETEFNLDETGSATIGRSPECELPITDGQASRRHCSVIKLGSGWEISDLGSTNGTLLNSVLVKKKKLRHGDVIRIGATEIQYHDPSAAGGGDAGEMSNCFLVYSKGDRKGDKIELSQQRTTLGRKESNTVVLTDGNASSYHAEIVRGLNGYTVRDLGSTNGTLVNNEMITEAPLSHGSRLRVGSTRFVFQDPAMAEIDLELAGVDDDETDWGMMRELDLAAVRKRNPATIIYGILFLGILGGLWYVTTLEKRSGPAGTQIPANSLIQTYAFESRADAFAWESDPPGLVNASVGKGKLTLRCSADSADVFYVDRFSGRNKRYVLEGKLGASGATVHLGMLWTGLGIKRWDVSQAVTGGVETVKVAASAPPWARRVRVGVRIAGEGSASLDDVTFTPKGAADSSSVKQGDFTISVAGGRAVDIAHAGAPILVNGRPVGDPNATITVSEEGKEHVVITVEGSGDELGIRFTEERGYLTRDGGFRGFGYKPGSQATYFARSFPSEGSRKDERVRKLLLGNPGKAIAVLPASDDQRLTSVATVAGKKRMWSISGPAKDGRFSVRFKTDLRGESADATARMGHALTLYSKKLWGEFQTEAERTLAEFPFANKMTQRQIHEYIVEVTRHHASLSREAHAMITDYEEFSDLASLDRVLQILGVFRNRYQVKAGEGDRGKEYAELDGKQSTMRAAAQKKSQTRLAKAVLEQAMFIHVPEGEVFSAAVMLTYITEWLPASDQAAEARTELARIEKERPQVLRVLKALGLGGK